MKMGTCADCGQPMHRGTTSLPQGVARCRECRKANPQPRVRTTPKAPPPYKAMKCAACGCAIWKGSSSRAEGEARCLDCYRASENRRDRRGPCLDCGVPSWGERCRPCQSKRQIVRAPDDERLLRHHREQAAPGLRPCDRDRLRRKWKRQCRTCTYCDRLADTIDHTVPLVRGGTNYEGNLVPCCRYCNGSKGGRTVMEWRAGKAAPRMAAPLSWEHEAKPLRIEAIRGEQVELFRVCVCGIGYTGRAAYCSSRCRARSAYRLRAGIPIGAPIMGDPHSSAERYEMRASA